MNPYSQVLLMADYDRTLTDPDSSIPERNLRAIREFMEQGGAFTLNTGRSLPMVKSLLMDVPVNAPMVLYNGSAAYDRETDSLTQLRPIDLPMWDTVEEVQARFPTLNLEIQGLDYHYSNGENPSWKRFYEVLRCPYATGRWGMELGPFLKFSLMGDLSVPTIPNLFREDPVESVLMDQAQQWLEQRFAGKVEVFRAGSRIIDVHARGVSKIRAARELQQRLGRKILICIGDAHNDIPMLDGADYAFCPSDGVIAQRYPNVCPCAQGAVADVIYKKIPEILGL